MMDISALKDCIGGLSKNIYFCGANENEPGPTLYARNKKTRLQLTELFRKKMKDDPTFGSIKIETTRSLKLKHTRSLEEILARVPHQTIYFDPTATIERAKILVDISKQVRQLLGPVLKGCYFNSEKRNIYFLVKQPTTEALDLTAILELLEPIILNNTQRLSHPFYYTITLSLHKPQGAVIAIDNLSIVKSGMKGLVKTLMNKLKWPLLLASTASSLGMTAAKAQEPYMPAVSNVNGWLGAAGVYLHNQRNSGTGAIGEAGVVAPLTPSLGAQVHGYDGGIRGANLESIDGYIFWRNPCQGLLGPHVLYTKSNDYHHLLVGLHGDLYVNQWTLTGEAGGANRSNRSNSYYVEAVVNWYVQPNWRFYVGGIDLGGDVTGQVGTEYLFGLSSLPGLSIFADAGVGAHNLNYGFIGLRYYFGDVCDPCKSLIRRHREDVGALPTPIDPIAKDKRHRPRISTI